MGMFFLDGNIRLFDTKTVIRKSFLKLFSGSNFYLKIEI